MAQLLSRLNTAQAFRRNSWRQGDGFAHLWKASLPFDCCWVAEERPWQNMGQDCTQRWQQLAEEREQARVTWLHNKNQLRARNSEGTCKQALVEGWRGQSK
jgi:hypothetical protein